MKKRMEINLSFIQFTFWVAFAVINAYAAFYLLSKGLSNTQIGLINALGPLAAGFLQPAVGSLIDAHPSITGKRTMILTIMLTSVTAIVLFFLPMEGLALSIVYGLLIMLTYVCEPLLNIIGVESMAMEPRLNFGIARSMGSFGYALSALILGVVLSNASPRAVPAAAFLCCLLTGVAVAMHPLKETERKSENKKSSVSSNPIVFLKKYPAYSLMLLGLCAIYLGHMVLNNFAIQIVAKLGGGSAEMGVGTFIAATAEMITVASFTVFLMKRFSLAGMMRFAAVGFLVKAVLTLISWNITTYYIAQFSQMFAWGVMTINVVYYVRDCMQPEDLAKGQSYLALTHTIGSLLGSLISGWVLDRAGIHTMLLISVIFSAIGCVLIFLSTPGRACIFHQKKA